MTQRSNRGLLKNIFSLGVLQVANLVFPLITLPVVARIIGPEKFGVINYAAAVVAYFTLLINFGFDLTATRTVAQNQQDKAKLEAVFSDIFYTKCLLFLVSLFAFLICLYELPSFNSDKLVAVYTYVICIAWIITPTWLFQGLQEIQKLAIFSLAAKFVFTITVLFLIRKAGDYFWQPLAFSLAQLFVSCISFVYACHHYKLKIGRFHFANVVQTLKEGKMFFLSLVTINLYTNTSVVILGLFHNSLQVGYYAAGNRLIGIAQALLFIPINYGLFPFIGSAFANNKEEGLRIIRRIFPVVLLVSLLYCACIFVAAPLAVHIIYGGAFKPAVKVLYILAFIPLIINFSALFGMQAMLNLKMDKVYFKVTLVGAAFGITINILLSKYFSYTGTAFAWLSTELLVSILFYYFLLKNKIQLISISAFTVEEIKAVIGSLVQKKPKTSEEELQAPIKAEGKLDMAEPVF